MNQFSEKYKTSTNIDLIRVIENKSDYQPEAVEAVEHEISERELSEIELEEVKSALETEQKQKEEQNAKRQKLENKINNFSSAFLDSINPIQKSAQTTEKLIRLITIIFGVISIFRWYSQFGYIKFMLTNNSIGWDIGMIETPLILISLPIATLLFWRRKKIGWILLTTYLTYSIIGNVSILLMTWNEEPSDGSALLNILASPPLTTQLLTILFFGGTLWTLIKNETRKQFQINRQIAIGTIAIAGVLMLISFSPFFLT